MEVNTNLCFESILIVLDDALPKAFSSSSAACTAVENLFQKAGSLTRDISGAVDCGLPLSTCARGEGRCCRGFERGEGRM